MRLLWWKGKRPPKASASQSGAPAVRGETRPSQELDPLLSFARDYLMLRGARVRTEGPCLLTAALPDGTSRVFTTSPSLANDRPDAEVLAQGGEALVALLDACAVEASVVALDLPPSRDVSEVARTALPPLPASCGQCALVGTRRTLAPCDACPLRGRSLAFAGLGPIRRVVEQARRDAWTVEVAFVVTSRDRQGRMDDVCRFAFDAQSGRERSPLAPDELARATGSAPPEAAGEMYESAVRQAEAAIQPVLASAGHFLALRVEPEYRRRRDDIMATFQSLRREADGDARTLDRGLSVELQRLDDTFGVALEATAVGVAFIRTQLVEVIVERGGGDPLSLTLDLGRGTALPPRCAICGREASAGSVCPRSHVTCRACLLKGAAATSCIACAGHLVLPASSDGDAASTGDRELDVVPSAGMLAILPPHVRAACVRWLAETRGVTVEDTAVGAGGVVLRGQRDGAPVAVVSPQAPPEWGLSEGDVRRAAAHATGRDGSAFILLSPHPASAEARSEAARLGVELWDGLVLDGTLAAAATAAENARRHATRQRETATALLRSIRDEGVVAMEQAEVALSKATPSTRLTGRQNIAGAVRAAEGSRDVLLQALIAWDTICTDYQASVQPRPRRDGGLDIAADDAALAALLERVRHLGLVTRDSASQLGAQPAYGDLGYADWFKAVGEELVARCEAVRWRLLALDPAKAGDFAAAHDQHAADTASLRAQSAERAAARSQQAFAALRQRARL